MRALFDVSHPAHVHLFRNAIEDLRSRGHNILVTSREKDITTDLLDAYGITHVPISEKGDSVWSLASEWIGREMRLLVVARLFDPDVMVSRLNPPAAQVSRVLGIPNLVFDDTEHARIPARLTHPFTDVICTPARFTRDLGPKQASYDGFHELAYLHPNWFEPDREALEDRGVDVDAPYSVLRFVAWGAHHDVGESGLSLAGKRELVSYLAERGPVYITSEDELPAEFEEYRLPVPPHMVHDLLSYANLYVGDSGTMSAEAAILGTPAVFVASFVEDGVLGNFTELEEYGLLSMFAEEEPALERATELANDPDATAEWGERRERLLADKIDVTEYMLELIAELSPDA